MGCGEALGGDDVTPPPIVRLRRPPAVGVRLSLGNGDLFDGTNARLP
jgi:hypothetical protein